MRRVALVLFLGCAACSLIFDMDRYDGASSSGGGRGDDGGTGTGSGDGGGNTPRDGGGTTNDAGSDDGSLQQDSAAIDAGCIPDIEPNSNPPQAIHPPVKVCGLIEDTSAQDKFSFTLTASKIVSIRTLGGMMYYVDDGSITGGGGDDSFNLGPGAHVITVYYSGGTGPYEITVP